jgi:hypothetical protein
VILVSPRLMDLAFVSRMLREHRLDAKPCADPLWSESARWKRVVEPHEWGAVMFVSDRDANQHYTLVLVGEVDVDDGAVDDGEACRRIVVPDWYQDLAVFFAKSSDAKETIEVPNCLGLHEPDHVCDGGVNGEGQTEPECQWRARCLIFQDHAAKKGQTPHALLAKLSPPDVVALTTRVPRKRPSVPKVNPIAYDIFSDIYRKLAELLYPRPFKTSKSSARVGDVFFVDKVPTSGYLHIYVQPESGRAIPLVGIRPKQVGGVDFQLPLRPDHPLLEPYREHVVAWRDGRFLSAFKRVPTRVPLEDACGVIRRAVEDGEIELPPVPLIEK